MQEHVRLIARPDVQRWAVPPVLRAITGSDVTYLYDELNRLEHEISVAESPGSTPHLHYKQITAI